MRLRFITLWTRVPAGSWSRHSRPVFLRQWATIRRLAIRDFGGEVNFSPDTLEGNSFHLSIKSASLSV